MFGRRPHIRGLVSSAAFGKVINVGAGEGSLLELLDKDTAYLPPANRSRLLKEPDSRAT